MKKRYLNFSKNWRRAGLLTAFVLSVSFGSQAQTAPPKLWDKTIGGTAFDYLACLKQTSDGGYILGGHTESGMGGDKTQASEGLFDYWVVKTDALGNKIWDRSYGSSANEYFRYIQQTSDGGYILAGVSNSVSGGQKGQGSNGDFDYWIVKIDAAGNKQWDRSLGGIAEEKLYAVQQTADGGYILGGSSKSGISGDKSQASQGDFDYWVVKLDANGTKQWDKTLGGSALDDLYALRQTADGGYILGGSSNSGIGGSKTQASNGLADYWIVKLDASGNKVWDKTYGGSADDVNVFSIQQTTDGGYVFAGTSASGISGDKTEASKGSTDFWLLKTDANGVKTWDKTLGGSNAETMRTMQQTADGGYVLGGYSNSGIGGDKTEASKGGLDFWIVQLNATGTKTWDKTLGTTNPEYLYSLHQTSDGGFFVGGMSGSGISGDKSQNSKGGPEDFWVVRLAATPSLAPNDIGVTAISGLTSGCNLSGQETITITVNNLGTASQSNVPVSYKINNGTPVNEIIPGPIAPNASITHSFTTKANLSATGVYAIQARTNLAGDAAAANDAVTISITNYAAPAAPTVAASGSTTFCSGNNVTLTASSSVPGISYQWYLNGNGINGATTAVYSASAAGNYTATAVIGGTCFSPASAPIAVTMASTPAAPTINVTGPLTICSGDSVALLAVSSATGATFSWYRTGTLIAGATNATYMAKLAGNYTATVTANGCSSLFSTARTITIKALPPTPFISQAGSLLTSSSNLGNQWYKNGAAIAGATNQTYNATTNGSYTVKVTDNGCSSLSSNAINVGLTGMVADADGLAVKVYPNPSTGYFTMDLPQEKTHKITVTDLAGKVIKQFGAQKSKIQVNLSDQAEGIYFLKITSESKTAVRKLVLVK